MLLCSYLADNDGGGDHRQDVTSTPGEPGDGDQQELVTSLEVALAAGRHGRELLQSGLVDHHCCQLQAEQADSDEHGGVEEKAGMV